ncbi:MAG: VOC family protein [Puniceicoccales bacterium]|jgi:catechol 2,3-dioxygenase-like lactoylglutathione lyase family enzyme|nr:VOC family protein [Puniceicoccales bacterium]
MSLKIKDIAFTAYPATNIPRSRKFYGEILGLKETMAMDFGDGKWWIEYEIGTGTLALSNHTKPSKDGGGPNIALEVENLDDAIAALEARGVKIAEVFPGATVINSPGCRFCFIKDPDGTPINIHQCR